MLACYNAFNIMATITIPQKLGRKGNFIAVPKEEYAAFRRWKKTVRVRLEDAWFWTSAWQKKEAEADAAIKAGKVRGPFSEHKSLIAALKRKSR